MLIYTCLELRLRRLRGDLAETERAARAAQAALREAEVRGRAGHVTVDGFKVGPQKTT